MKNILRAMALVAFGTVSLSASANAMPTASSVAGVGEQASASVEQVGYDDHGDHYGNRRHYGGNYWGQKRYGYGYGRGYGHNYYGWGYKNYGWGYKHYGRRHYGYGY